MHTILTETLACFLPGQAKDLSAPLQQYFSDLILYLFNPLNAKLNPIFPLLAIFGAHHILRVSRKRVKFQVC